MAEKLIISDGSKVLVYTPRKLASVQAILKHKPERLVLVSCNPATLARDAALLAEAGWVVTRAQPFDMFPRTGHCETVCLLQK